MSGFYTAAEAAKISNNRTSVNLEINKIEEAVMTAAAAGAREIIVGPSSSPPIVSGFTASAVHYNAYADPLNNQTDAHLVARAQMNEVIGHFQQMNYTVRRSQYQSTETFNWTIKW